MNQPSKPTIVLFSVITGIILLTGSSAFLAVSVYLKRSDAGIVRALGSWLPAAKVGSTTIRYGQVLHTRDTLKIYLTSDAAKNQGFGQELTPELEKKATVERLMRDQVIEQMAAEHNVKVTDDEVKTEFDKMTAAASTTMPNVGEFLQKNFGWNETEFRTNVVRPAILETRVAQTYGTSTPDAAAKFQKDVEDRLTGPTAKIYLKY